VKKLAYLKKKQYLCSVKTLLADYIFSDTLRYENHRLIYIPSTDDRMEIGGFLAAAVLGALLYGQEEGRERGISLNIREGRKEFFVRYEDETLHENGGLFTTEVQALSEAYMEIDGELSVLLAMCGNERLYDLAFGLMIDYMEVLVEEQICEHIYDLVPWSEPFAKWLYNAGYVETRRQQLLAIDWTDPAIVCALSEFLRKPKEETQPTFVFGGLNAEQLLNGYWNWLWDTVQQNANLYPDAKERLAQYKQTILANETNYDFLKPEIGKLQPSDINLFRKWMGLWKDFVEQQIKLEPPKRQKKDEEQLFFPDNTLTCPTEETEDRYAATREYIKERKRYDKEFAKFVKNSSHAKLCRQLTLLFGWYVEPSTLRKSLLRSPKRKTKKYT